MPHYPVIRVSTSMIFIYKSKLLHHHLVTLGEVVGRKMMLLLRYLLFGIVMLVYQETSMKNSPSSGTFVLLHMKCLYFLHIFYLCADDSFLSLQNFFSSQRFASYWMLQLSTKPCSYQPAYALGLTIHSFA